jgi:GTP cyclohydrolase I
MQQNYSIASANGYKINGSNSQPAEKDLLHALPFTDDMKIHLIQHHFSEIMRILGLDLEDDSLKDTPARVAKMYVKEVFSGLNPENRPAITVFENKYNYGRMVLEKNITLHSYCEHHLVPIVGKAHVAYIPGRHVIGLSKLNRIVQFYSRKPQVQERLTEEIAAALKEALQTEDVAVMIDAVHFCVASRGVQDVNSSTVTSHFSGKFENADARNEFLSAIK